VHRISNSNNRHCCIVGNPIYSIGGNLLRQSNEMRDLGITVDTKLSFNSYMSDITHNAHVCASLILRTFVCKRS